jgi:hypothetical protein
MRKNSLKQLQSITLGQSNLRKPKSPLVLLLPLGKSHFDLSDVSIGHVAEVTRVGVSLGVSQGIFQIDWSIRKFRG